VMMYPLSRPHVKAAPPIAGPMARPIALMETAKPFSVPRILKLVAEFVSRMMEQGKAKMTAKDLTTMIAMSAICCKVESSMSAVNGVTKHIMGKVIAQALKQGSTPKYRAQGGKMRNWMKHPTMP